MYDIQTWLGSPCIYVYDCNNAGNILSAFTKFALQRDAEMALQSLNISKEPVEITAEKAPSMSAQPSVGSLDSRTGGLWTPLSGCIQLAACRSNELLPMHPDLPADLFTCCLTTPIEIALRWFVSENLLIKNITTDMLKKIPGRLNDRRTPLGELNWIFTAITDTIAWDTLPHALFQTLFRQDLMVAALFRNSLLAERIMRHYGCRPMSSPVIPTTYQHPMWQAWDLVLDVCLTHLPNLLDESQSYEYVHSSFFAAFEVICGMKLTRQWTIPAQRKRFSHTADDASSTVTSWADIKNESCAVGSILNSIYGVVWKSFFIPSVDSFPSVSLAACPVVDKVVKRIIFAKGRRCSYRSRTDNKKKYAETSSVADGNLRQFKSILHLIHFFRPILCIWSLQSNKGAENSCRYI